MLRISGSFRRRCPWYSFSFTTQCLASTGASRSDQIVRGRKRVLRDLSEVHPFAQAKQRKASAPESLSLSLPAVRPMPVPAYRNWRGRSGTGKMVGNDCRDGVLLSNATKTEDDEHVRH